MGNKEIEIIKESFREINKRESELRQARESLEQDLIRLQQKKLKALVGMAFKIGLNYYIITDVPQIMWTMTRKDFNPYQLPCLVVRGGEDETEVILIEEETLFSRAVDAEDPRSCIQKEHEGMEITIHQFREKLEQAFQRIRDYAGT